MPEARIDGPDFERGSRCLCSGQRRAKQAGAELSNGTLFHPEPRARGGPAPQPPTPAQPEKDDTPGRRARRPPGRPTRNPSLCSGGTGWRQTLHKRKTPGEMIRSPGVLPSPSFTDTLLKRALGGRGPGEFAKGARTLLPTTPGCADRRDASACAALASARRAGHVRRDRSPR